MADLSFFQNEELEDSSNGMEDEYGKPDDQQALGDSGVAGDKDQSQLTPLDGIISHALSEKPADRQMVGKLLINMFQNAVKLKLDVRIEEISEPIDYIMHDSESTVKSSLVECFPHLILICQESPLLFDQNLVTHFLEAILFYLRDPENQVRQDAQTALRVLLERGLLDEQQIQNVCSVIVELSRDNCMEFQTLALTLMTKVNPYIGDELTEKLFLDRFLELCNSNGWFVRRVCAAIMGEFCTIMSKETIYTKLLQAYSNLCQDVAWSVRKTSVDVMMSVARCVPLSLRRNLLSKLLINHLRDDSRWVKRSAYEILGPFISTFAKQFHELICDQKGELVLVYENEHGWPRFNIVPVAKVSDILNQNLRCTTHPPDFDVNHPNIWKQSKRKYKKVILNKCLISKTKVHAKFNLFQYYYDPPDMPLDPKLVESIINDNERTNTNETNNELQYPEEKDHKSEADQKPNDDTNNKNTIIENQNEQFEDCNKNTENATEQQNEEFDDNENNHSNDQQNKFKRDKKDIEGLDNRFRIKIYDRNVCEKLNDDDEENEDEENEDEENEDEDNDDEENEDKGKRRLMHDYGSKELYFTRSPNSTEIDTSVTLTEYSYNTFNDNTFNDTIGVSDSSLDQGSSNLSNLRQSTLSSLSNMINSDDDQQEEDTVPLVLIEHFVSIPFLQPDCYDIGTDLDYHCAYSFPAVVLTLGKNNWHRLKDAYHRLSTAVAWKVRSTLASGIHEIAIIIEKEYTARDLVPIFNGFIKDLDEVRIGALKNFSTFLKVLSPQDRMQYLPKLSDFLVTDSNWNWRLREELVKQLALIIHLYECFDVAQYVVPLLLHLIRDRVAAVRQGALSAVAETISYLINLENDPIAIAMIQEIREMLITRASERWIIRQTYALVCSELVSKRVISTEIFSKELLPYLLELSTDKVPNVRLVVARTLARDVVEMSDLDAELLSDVQEKLKVMQEDCDRDVRIFASKVESDTFY